MDPYGKRELLEFYNRHLERFGDSPLSLRWTPEGQRRRYEALLEVSGDLTGKNVLDFGCGKGDLWAFLAAREQRVSYCGLDVNPNLIALARRKHPGAEFLCLDIEEEDLRRTFDVILICGVFNLRIAGIADSMRRVLEKLYARCREALHLNVLSSSGGDIDLYAVKPEELLAFAESRLTKSAILREGLIEGDLFLSLYRN